MTRGTTHRQLRTRLLAGAATTLAVALGLAVPAAAPAVAATPDPSLRAQVQKILDDFRTTNGLSGMAVAVVTPTANGKSSTVQVVTSGSPTMGGKRPVVRQTQFEIGSESKSFTAGLLAAAVAAGRVSLDDPLQKYVPAGVTVPSFHDNGVDTPITLRDLATHTSGLVDEPGNLYAGCPDQKPCAQAKQNYTEQMLWDGIQHAQLQWKPGTKWLYSNWAFGLLGTILANLTLPGLNPPAYGAVLAQNFFGPLHMTSTELERPTSRLATPYTASGAVAPPWNNVNALAGGGGLISDITDMGVWVQAMLGYEKRVPSVAALPSALTPQATITEMCTDPKTCEKADFQMGLAWQLYGPEHRDVGVPWAFKDGGTSGMHSVTVLAPTRGVGVTLLSNGGRVEPDPLGAQILKLALATQ